MSSTTLERLRSRHEEIEYYERATVNTLNDKPRRHRDRILQGHRTNRLLEKVAVASEKCLELYKDDDGTFKDEIQSMRGTGIFTSFYERLKEIREFHKKYPGILVTNEPDMQQVLNPELEFSGEERFGRYVDLHEFYSRFMNIPAFLRCREELIRNSRSFNSPENFGYVSYLSCFYDFNHVQQSDKLDQKYCLYIQDLLQYLLGFYRRTQPLVDLDDVMDETTSKFEKDWALNNVSGWNSTMKVDDSSNLYCAPCGKKFVTEGVFKGHLTGKKHKKAVAMQNSIGAKVVGDLKEKQIALIELKIKKICELLTEVIDSTKSYVEIKQTRTHEELQAEILEDEQGALPDIELEAEDDDEDAPVYNPLNLPLGWDGKPIPYWLYKLHGLGIEYKCEICGNHSYWGRRAFDRHFQEWRHAHGMRCLRIPNTKHFHDITLIEDAINLYDKIKDSLAKESWEAGDEEEFEDTEGNVLNKKTYEDLARQGLL